MTIPLPLIAFAALLIATIAVCMALFNLVAGRWAQGAAWALTAGGTGWLFCAFAPSIGALL